MNKAPHPFDALMEITSRPPTVFVRGEGSVLWDDTGRRYLDLSRDGPSIASDIRRLRWPKRWRHRQCS